MSHYSEEFKNKLVSKLLCPSGPSVSQLAKESGVSKTALYKWVNIFENKSINNIENRGNNMVVTQTKSVVPIRPQNWSAEDKLNAVIVTNVMTDEEIGAYCRDKGIYTNHIKEWKLSLVEGLKPSANKEQRSENIKLKSEIKSLKADLHRKESALAETTALLVLKKKANLIWGDGKDD